MPTAGGTSVTPRRRPGRPLKGDAPLSRRLEIRLTVAEHEWLRERAQRFDVTMGDYLRTMIQQDRMAAGRPRV